MDLTFSAADDAFRAECRAWLGANVPHDLPPLESDEGFPLHRAWDRRLYEGGWAVITWPVEYGGRAASLLEWLIFEEEYHRAGGQLRSVHNGTSLLAPALFDFGTPEQKARYLRRIAAAEDIWCQGWSEPGAGSDLAGITSRAVRDDAAGGWRLGGQKTWSTRGAYASHLFGLFRTDPDAPRHRGLTYFLVPLDTPGVTVRGFGRLDGEVAFSEIFFDDAFVPDDAVLGGVNRGWHVAMATTSNERGVTLRSPGWFLATAERLVEQWRSSADPADTRLADAVARCYADAVAYRWQCFATIAKMEAGHDPGPEASMSKVWWSELDVRMHELALELIGPDAELAEQPWVRGFLTSLSGPIWGGTNEIQRNVIAERVLGLPRR